MAEVYKHERELIVECLDVLMQQVIALSLMKIPYDHLLIAKESKMEERTKVLKFQGIVSSSILKSI